MTPDQYWRFVALAQRIEIAIQRAMAAKVQLYADHGLDPSVGYDLDDQACVITPHTDPPRDEPHG